MSAADRMFALTEFMILGTLVLTLSVPVLFIAGWIWQEISVFVEIQKFKRDLRRKTIEKGRSE